MTVSPFSLPILLLTGIGCAILYQQWLVTRNEDWFIALGTLAIGVAWLHLLIAVVTGQPPLHLVPIHHPETSVQSVFYALSYPFWFRIGAQIVFLLVGRRPEEGGILWLYRIEDTTEDFDASWE